MAFFIFVLLLSVISFCVVILCYGLTLKFFHGSKVAQWIITPLAVVGWNFLVITRNDIFRLILGALPVVAVVGLLLYSKFKYNEPTPTPLELAKKQNGQSRKAHKAAPKHSRQKTNRNSKKSKK